MIAQRENFTAGFAEFEPLTKWHWKEIALWQDDFPLDPLWGEYFKRDSAGQVLYVTLRKEGKLVGYYIGFLSPALHYASCKVLMTDIWYVMSDARGMLGGRTLIRKVIEEAKRESVDVFFIGAKVHKESSLRAQRFLSLLDFVPTDTLMSMRI